jgi:hypothetical protein
MAPFRVGEPDDPTRRVHIEQTRFLRVVQTGSAGWSVVDLRAYR